MAVIIRPDDVSAFSCLMPRAKKIRHAKNIARCQLDDLTGGACDVDLTSSDGDNNKSSHIVSIKSSNIAGMVSDGEDTDIIQLDFGPDACLVAVTGESGSGKSLLVSKAIDLVTGGKALSSLVPSLPSGEGILEDETSSYVELSECVFDIIHVFDQETNSPCAADFSSHFPCSR